MGVNCERATNLEFSPKKSHFGFCGWILSAKRCELDVFCQSQSCGKQMKHHFDRLRRKKAPTFFSSSKLGQSIKIKLQSLNQTSASNLD